MSTTTGGQQSLKCLVSGWGLCFYSHSLAWDWHYTNIIEKSTDINACIRISTNNCPVSKTWCWLKFFFYNVQLWLILYDRLAIYYLNAVSKGYQQANMDLKRKMQMVSIRAGLLAPSCIFLLFFKSQSSYWATGFLVNTSGSRWGEEPQKQQGQH